MTRYLSSNLLNIFLVIASGINLVFCQDATSLLTGLLSTFAESSKSPGCPGECRHALSALFCSYVQDDADCGDPKLRCCTDPPEVAPPLPHHDENDPVLDSNGDHVDLNRTTVDDIDHDRPTDVGDHTFHRPPMLTQASPISVGTNLTVRPGAGQQNSATSVSRPLRRRTTTPSQSVETSTGRETMIPTPAALTGSRVKPVNGPLSPCIGICVTRTVASFCSQISEVGQCSQGEACCLTGDEITEPEMTLSSSSTSTLSPPSVFTSTSRRGVFSTAMPSMTTIKSLPGTTTESDEKMTTVTVIRKQRPSSRPPINNRHKQPSSILTSTRVPPRRPIDDTDDNHDQCPGSCIMGLLSMLCDGIDSSVTCSNGGKCCISKNSSPSETRISTPRPPVTNCPGICLPSMLTGVCNRPAVLLPEALDCDAGTVCCDNSLREAGHTTTTTTASPLMDLLSWPLKLAAASNGGSNASNAVSSLSSAIQLGSALSGLFGGGSATSSIDSPPTPLMNGPPMFSNANHGNGNTMMSSTNSHLINGGVGDGGSTGGGMNPTGIERIHTGPGCPGTCIASFLKMTCFGSSQIVENLLCPKDNLVCCAPKASLIGFNPDLINNDNHWNQTGNHIPPTDASAVIGYTQRPANNRYVCGMKGAIRPETPRVVGGRDASPGEWCWQVALINSLNQYLCGGALIGRQWVLTAAHCVTNLIRSGDAIYIRVGDYDLTSKYGSPGAQTLRVATTYIHHNHNSQTLDNNIALLKLEKQVDLKEGVCLVCLPARGVAVQTGKRCFVTGYGYMGESGPIPLRIRAAMLPVVSEQECVRKINAVTEKIFILPASSFCAGGEEGHDACQGDGGGPMSCEVDGYYEITGIVSWGFGCGRVDVPGIYVKVSSFIGWINQIISVNNI